MPERLDGGEGVRGGAVELLAATSLDAVLLTADHADLDLEHDVGLGSLREQLLRDLEVLLERYGGAVPHVRLEQRVLAGPDALDRDRQQRADEAVQLVLGAVVGVQRDVDGVVLRHLGGVRREGHRAGDHVLDGRAGEVLRTTGGDLDDAVAPGLGETGERGVERLRGGDVDRREREGLRVFAVSSISAYFSGVAMGMVPA